MFDAHLQVRVARSCTDAAFGYARAATAAYANLAAQTLDFWTSAGTAADAWCGSSTTRGTAARAIATPFDFWLASSAEFAKAFSWRAPFSFHPPQSAFSPMTAWFGMFPLNATPSSWPMAYAFMAAGIPRSVAWPAAEANDAVLDAAEAATASFNSAFANYRSESGYAMAQIVSPRRLQTALLLAPFGASLAFPWSLAYPGLPF